MSPLTIVYSESGSATRRKPAAPRYCAAENLLLQFYRARELSFWARLVPMESRVYNRLGFDRAEVAEWQTRYVQGVVPKRAWEFKSPLRH